MVQMEGVERERRDVCVCVVVVHVRCEERRTHDGIMQQHPAPVTHTHALARAHALHDGVENLMWCVCALKCDLSMHMTHGHMHMTIPRRRVARESLSERVE